MDRIRIGLAKAAVWTVIALFVALTVAVGEARQRRQAAETPRQAAESALDSTGRVSQVCEVIQTMGFTRCGHSVTRRVAAPSGVVGADFEGTQAYYSLWQIGSFSPYQVTMSREIDLYCPMHTVLTVNEAGEIVRTHNVYGDGMAVDQTYDRSVGEFDGETQIQLLLGLGFDTPEDAEEWLEAH